MRHILIVEDCECSRLLLTQIVDLVFPDAMIYYAQTATEAFPQIPSADLVITDFDFPDGGFPSLLPLLIKEKRYFILQSADPDCVKIYNHDLQLGAVIKGKDFLGNMLSILKKEKEDLVV